MKQRYWLFQRGNTFYLEDSETGKKESLKTRDPRQAERLRMARNEAAEKPMFGLTIGRAYLSASDPQMVKRTWQNVMDAFVPNGRESSKDRRMRAMKSPVFAKLKVRKIVETTADDFRAVLADGKSSTQHFLRCLHNLAMGLGWLPWAILPPKLWPKIRSTKRRAIHSEEHQRIIATEKNVEHRLYYDLLWEIGAAQSDAAGLTAANIDWRTRVLSFQRCKTGEWAHFVIGERLEQLLRQLPANGPLFPELSQWTASSRSSEFCRRCRLAEVENVSLHSYRYAWAERAMEAGYPERWAQKALGHKSRAVHQSYARGAVVNCPPLETYESQQKGNVVAMPTVTEVSSHPAVVEG